MARPVRRGGRRRPTILEQSTFEFFRNTLPITMRRELIFRSGRTHPAHARSTGAETLSRFRSLAATSSARTNLTFRKPHDLLEHSGVAPRPRDACNEAAADTIGGIDGQATPPCGVFA